MFESPPPSTILVVDDHQVNLNVLNATLKNQGYQTICKQSGEAALLTLETVTPALILLDVLMPGIDGFETCRLIKAQNHLEDIPIIFISALTDQANKVKGFEEGAVDYITKPFHKAEVTARVKTHLTLQYQKNELKKALKEIQTLSGLLPICAKCKKIRNDQGYWEQIEVFFRGRSNVQFSHGICPECNIKLYGEYYDKS